jgi:transcriptional regulator with XRE-family HTH domain
MAAVMSRNPDPVDVQVGAKLRLQRQFCRFSQGRVGDAIGLTFQQIQKYESGVNRISASRLQELSNFLGVPVSYFFDAGSATGDLQNGRASEFLSSADGWKLNRAYLGIKDPAIRAVILSLVETLAEMKDTSGRKGNQSDRRTV